jgi:hypothetical protein
MCCKSFFIVKPGFGHFLVIFSVSEDEKTGFLFLENPVSRSARDPINVNANPFRGLSNWTASLTNHLIPRDAPHCSAASYWTEKPVTDSFAT